MMLPKKFVFRFFYCCIALLALAACVPTDLETAVTVTPIPSATMSNNPDPTTAISTPLATLPVLPTNQGQPLPDLPTPTPLPATAVPESPSIFSGAPIKVGRGQILDAAFLPDGDSQAIALGWANGVSLVTLDGTEKWWQPTNALLIALDASPQGDQIAAVLEDGSVVILAAETGAMQQYAASRPYVYWSDIAFSPDGQQVAFQSIGPQRGDPIYLLNVRTGELQEVPQSRIDSTIRPFLVWSPDGQTITQAALGEECSRLVNRDSGETELTLKTETTCYAPWTIAYAPDGQKIAVALPTGGAPAILWIKDAEIAPLICCCAPGADHKEFLLLSRDIGLTMESQLGSDLGERMAHAASSRLVSGRTVVLIGGDCPALQPRHLLQTLTWLDGDCDAVIGPAEDGGYVLLGLKKCSPELFRGIAWGGDTVLEETRSRLQELRWQWRELEPLWDLDRPADLERFREMSD